MLTQRPFKPPDVAFFKMELDVVSPFSLPTLARMFSEQVTRRSVSKMTDDERVYSA